MPIDRLITAAIVAAAFVVGLSLGFEAGVDKATRSGNQGLRTPSKFESLNVGDTTAPKETAP